MISDGIREHLKEAFNDLLIQTSISFKNAIFKIIFRKQLYKIIHLCDNSRCKHLARETVLEVGIIVYLCKYFPSSRAFSLMCVDYLVYARASHHSRGVVASVRAFLAYTAAHQVENIYKDEL